MNFDEFFQPTSELEWKISDFQKNNWFSDESRIFGKILKGLTARHPAAPKRYSFRAFKLMNFDEFWWILMNFSSRIDFLSLGQGQLRVPCVNPIICCRLPPHSWLLACSLTLSEKKVCRPSGGLLTEAKRIQGKLGEARGSWGELGGAQGS